MAAQTGRLTDMAQDTSTDRLLAILRDTIVGSVRRNGPDMSARQFAIFMIVYIEEDEHTVRGLAARLDISKPAITRSLDRMAELDLIKRGPDARDRRSVLVLRTRTGQDLLRDLRGYMAAAARPPAAKLQAMRLPPARRAVA